MARGRGDVLLWEGVVAVMGVVVVLGGGTSAMGVVGAVREPRYGLGEGRGGGCCGESRASPCSLRSRPPSRGEGGVTRM